MWNYYRDEPSTTNFKSFKYKISIVGKTPEGNDSLTNAKAVIPLKHLSNFWRSLNIPLINCELELILTWPKNCVLADMTVDADADPAIVAPSGATFKLKETKLYVPVVTLSKQNDTKLLEQLKSGFKRTRKWNKYRWQMTVQPQKNNKIIKLIQHLQVLKYYFFFYFKELLEKTIQQKIVEIIFHIIMYRMSQ